jgi:hypothetical protein
MDVLSAVDFDLATQRGVAVAGLDFPAAGALAETLRQRGAAPSSMRQLPPWQPPSRDFVPKRRALPTLLPSDQ